MADEIAGEVTGEVTIAEPMETDVSTTNPITNPNPVDVGKEPEEPEAEPAAKPEPEPIPKGVQKRIDRAVRQKYEAEARTKMLEERLAALETRQQPIQPRQTDTAEPTIDKFDNFDQYVAAKAEYIAKKQIESTLTEREQRQRAEREATERTKTVESWNKRMAAATAEMPDFEDIVSSSDVPMTESMQQAIMESDVGPKLAYYLASHPDEAAEIGKMSAIGSVRALGRIEERLAGQQAAVKTTSAPPPIKPVGARATVKKDPGQMSDAEYAKWRKTA